jgi:uncharacterized membrane protein YesL
MEKSMSFFSVDGPLYRFISRFWDMIKLNLLWLLCSLPIVTMGASTAAAFSITLKMVDEQEGYIAKDFFKAFKSNLKQGSIMGILFLIALVALWLDFQFFNLLDTNPVIFLIMGFVGIFIFTLTFLYAFPLLARYQNSIINTMKNSFDISIRYFVRTLLLIFVLIFEVMICMWNEWTLIVGVLIGPACIFLTISGFALRFFRELEKEAQT